MHKIIFYNEIETWPNPGKKTRHRFYKDENNLSHCRFRCSSALQYGKKLHLSRELKKSWNMMIMIPSAVGVIKAVSKKEKRLSDIDISGRIKTIRVTALLK